MCCFFRFSVSNDLKYDAERDLRDIGAKNIQVHSLNKVSTAVHAPLPSLFNLLACVGWVAQTCNSLFVSNLVTELAYQTKEPLQPSSDQRTAIVQLNLIYVFITSSPLDDIFFIHQFKYGKISSKHNGSVKKGVIFATYSSLIGESQSGGKYKTRFQQLLHWCGEDFDGVVSFIIQSCFNWHQHKSCLLFFAAFECPEFP